MSQHKSPVPGGKASSSGFRADQGENMAGIGTQGIPSRLPLPRQVASAIRSRIINGHWEPGDQIPAEDELARQFGVSRATVREAVALLTVQGYLVKRRGIGTFVAQAQAISGGLESLISITQWIEAHGYQPGTSYVEMGSRSPTAQEAEELSFWHPEMVTEIHRVRTANGVPVLYCIDVLQVSLAPKTPDSLDESLFQYLERDWGQVVIFARTAIEVTQATPSMAHHLQIDPETPLLRLRQAHFNQQSLPILLSQDHFVTDRFHFNVLRHRQ